MPSPRDPAVIGGYWKARKAFVTAVGGSRPPGTTLITEDFAVPPARLADAGTALLELQSRHGFDTAVAGHAAHGNLHFLLAFDAAKPDDMARHAAFMAEFCRLVVARFDGSLKAEHATGRNIAPFLALEWGPRATELMWRIKELVDPRGVLAPRVLLDRDPRARLRGLKTLPGIEAAADPCIECGFCEPTCPSADLTTTPRQRIVLRIVEAAWGWTAGGRLPLVVDASSCTLGLAREVVPYLTPANRALHDGLTVVDSVVWAAERLLPHLERVHTAGSAVLHPSCAMAHLGNEEQLREVAEACAREVVVRDDAGCCAFAGDRGMLHRELTESATAKEAAEVTGRHFDAYLSANRMCEIGMDHATGGRGYHSVLLALERATRPGPPDGPGDPGPSGG